MSGRLVLVFVAAVMVLVAAGRAAVDPDTRVSVERKPPTHETIRFDPRNPPADIPRLDAREDALCQFNFQLAARFDSVTREQTRLPTGEYRLLVDLERVRITLTLHNRIYLPLNATAKLERHEEGHRLINERVYESATLVAKEQAARVLERQWEGIGLTPSDAVDDAIQRALHAIADAYHQRVSQRALKIGQIYDRLTAHGRRARPTEAEAIEQAFAEFDNPPSGEMIEPR